MFDFQERRWERVRAECMVGKRLARVSESAPQPDLGSTRPRADDCPLAAGRGRVQSEIKELETIKEIMIDMRSGPVAYAVMPFGGFPGVGGNPSTDLRRVCE
jgi:hypothetical protein